MRLGRRETATEAVLEAQRRQREGDPAARLAFTEVSVRRFPKDAAVRLEHAHALASAAPDRAAGEALRAVALERAPDPARLTRAARLLLVLGEPLAAGTCIERAELAGPTNVVIRNELSALRGAVAAREGDLESAELLLAAAHHSDRTNELYARDLATAIIVRSDGRRLADALAVLDETLATQPAEGALYEHARTMLADQRAELQSALEQPGSTAPRPLGAAAAEAPRQPGGETNAGATGLSERATASTATLGRRGRSSAQTVARAQALMAEGKAERYAAFARKALRKFPRDAAVRLEYATALAPRSPAEAIAAAREIPDLDAADELTRTALVLRAVRLLVGLGAVTDAGALLGRVAGTASSQPMLANEAMALRGLVAAARGEHQAAEAELRSAHLADPVNSAYAADLAELLLARGARDEAIEVIECTLATPQRDGYLQAQAARRLQRLLGGSRREQAGGPGSCT